jgi:hypothetical protein
VLENQQGRPLIDVGGDGKVVESVGKIDCRNDYDQASAKHQSRSAQLTFAWDAELDGRFSF